MEKSFSSTLSAKQHALGKKWGVGFVHILRYGHEKEKILQINVHMKLRGLKCFGPKCNMWTPDKKNWQDLEKKIFNYEKKKVSIKRF